MLADIPGLIEGASEGAGLGHEFLRHVERTRLLLHVLDISGCEGRDPLEDLDIINNDLAKYKELSKKPQLIVCNKMDMDGAQENLERLQKKLEGTGTEIFPVSAATVQGFAPLVNRCMELLRELPPIESFEEESGADEFKPAQGESFIVRRENDWFVVEGPGVDGLMQRINMDDAESMAYFERTLRRMGVIDELRAKGATDGDNVRMGDVEFEFIN